MIFTGFTMQTNDLRAGLVSGLAVEILLLLAVFPRQVQIYDMPTAMFFALGLLFLERRQLTAFSVIYPLSCLNRETTILLTLLFAVHFYRTLDRRSYWAHLAFQCVVYAVIFVTIRLIFANAPGQP